MKNFTLPTVSKYCSFHCNFKITKKKNFKKLRNIKWNSLFILNTFYIHFSSVQLLSHVWLLATPWAVACQASLSITNSQTLLRLMSIKSVMPSNHLILCCPLLLPPSIFPSIRVFSNESVLHIRWQKYWSFSFSISHLNEYSELVSFNINFLYLYNK